MKEKVEQRKSEGKYLAFHWRSNLIKIPAFRATLNIVQCFKFSSNDDQIHIMYVVFDKEECKSRNNNNDANSAFWKGWLVAVAHTQDRIPVAVLLLVVN